MTMCGMSDIKIQDKKIKSSLTPFFFGSTHPLPQSDYSARVGCIAEQNTPKKTIKSW